MPLVVLEIDNIVQCTPIGNVILKPNIIKLDIY